MGHRLPLPIGGPVAVIDERERFTYRRSIGRGWANYMKANCHMSEAYKCRAAGDEAGFRKWNASTETPVVSLSHGPPLPLPLGGETKRNRQGPRYKLPLALGAHCLRWRPVRPETPSSPFGLGDLAPGQDLRTHRTLEFHRALGS